ncbi:uncharacterized protein FFB14_08649 [Fusarium fujikuroi]|nr:uncharacterized protein FFB14_08649 [Fusarium fujikuroi]
MEGMLSQSSPFASGDHHATIAGSSLLSINSVGPAHLHNVDIYIWEISYQSATVTRRDLSTQFVTSASSPNTTDSGTSSRPQKPHQSTTEDADQHRPVSPTTPVAIGSEFSISPPGEALPALNRDNSRRALCPECRAYTSKRSFNMKRHRKACNKNAESGRIKAIESIRSRVSGATPF